MCAAGAFPHLASDEDAPGPGQIHLAGAFCFTRAGPRKKFYVIGKISPGDLAISPIDWCDRDPGISRSPSIVSHCKDPTLRPGRSLNCWGFLLCTVVGLSLSRKGSTARW